MVLFDDEMAFYSKTAIAFESYMFATAEKFEERHDTFENMIFGMFNRDDVPVLKKVETLSERKGVISEFNNMLKTHGITANTDAKKSLMMANFYLNNMENVENDLAILNTYFEKYAKEYDSIICYSLHFNQRTEDLLSLTIPHIHVIYKKNMKMPLSVYIGEN